MKSGRVPQGITHCMGFWKAEGFHKFAFPASECMLGGVILKKEYHIWILVACLTELFFGHGTGRFGWIPGMLQLVKHLTLRHNILTEEQQRLKSCRVIIIHILDDVDRFSSPDDYWCFSFERAKYI